MRVSSVRLSAAALAIGVTLISGPVSALDEACWSATGWAATVDESDVAKVVTGSNGIIRISPDVNSAVGELRYHIVPVNGVSEQVLAPGAGPGTIQLTMRYKDNGASAQVRATLRGINLTTGAATTLGTATSLDGGNPEQTTSYCFDAQFNFDNNAYVLEVELDKVDATGDPRLRTVKICETEGAGCVV
jgi:hypothetical protein